MPLVTRIRIVKPAKGYWFNFDKYRVAPFHRHSPRFIRLILAFFFSFFFLFSFFLFLFYFHDTYPLTLTLPLGLGLNYEGRDAARMGFSDKVTCNYWTKLNLFYGIGLIDGRRMRKECSIPCLRCWESRVIRNWYFPLKEICNEETFFEKLNKCINFLWSYKRLFLECMCILESFRIQRRINGWRWRFGNYQGKSSCTSGIILVPRKPLSGIKLDEWGKKTVALMRLSRMPFGRAIERDRFVKINLGYSERC